VEKEFVELINKHQGIIHKICNVYFYGNTYKDDYYQEIMIRLWKSFPNFKKECAFSTWMYRVALNTAIDILRKQKMQPTYIELTHKENIYSDDESNAGSEMRDKLYEAIHCLNDLEKAIIILYHEDYDYKEIAEIIGITESNTGVKISRIKNQLIKILENGQK
jgi:RNA polymerase sigma-70 factor, ECF subfamily